MKTKLTHLVTCIAFLFGVYGNVNAQKKLIHFWDFNQTMPAGGGGGDSLATMASPLLPDYTTLASASAGIVYVRTAGDSIVDNGNPGSFYYDYSSSNYMYFTSSDSANGNNYIKVRNACAGAYLYMHIPTTSYQNIVLNFSISASSSKGAQYNIFSYSTDGGTTWNKLTSAMDTFNMGGVMTPDTLLTTNSVTSSSNWYPVQIDFSSDPAVNNNPNFIVRFTFAGSNTTTIKGNDRYDNFAVMGDTVMTTPTAKSLIHFWDFNQSLPLGGGGGDSLGTVTYPLLADYSVMPSSNPQIVYSRPVGNNLMDNGSPGSFYYDYSSSNYTYFTSSDSSNGNAFVRARNASTGSAIYFYLPTTGYKNIEMQYSISASSAKGAQYNVISYTTDGGTTWTPLTMAMDTFNIGGRMTGDTLQMINPTTATSNWYPVQIDFSSDPAVNDNANFMVRFALAGSNTSLTSGNDRYDNISLLGESQPAGINEINRANTYLMYPNPAGNYVSISGGNAGRKIVTMYNVIGEEISKQQGNGKQFILNTSTLNSGLYFVNIKEVESGKSYTLKLVKN